MPLDGEDLTTVHESDRSDEVFDSVLRELVTQSDERFEPVFLPEESHAASDDEVSRGGDALQEAGDWNAAGDLLARDARHLENAGADLVLLCTNTMHVVAPAIEAALTVPFLHLADTTADAVVTAGLDQIALLGTRYTMEQDFYRGRLEAHDLTVLVPDEPDRTTVHDIIYAELVRGVVTDESRARYLEVIDRLLDRGAQGVIAGCTEIELLVAADDVAVPYFPTARLHADAAVAAALGSARR